MNRIKQLRKEKGYTQETFCKILSIAQPTLSGYETGKTEPDFDTAYKIAEKLNVSIDYLLGKSLIQNNQQGVWIPVYGEIAAGIPLECITDIIDYEQITEEMAQKGEHIALAVRGDSMAPRISSGDVVIIRLQPNIENGEIAAVIINGNSATLKKVKKSDEGLTLISLNPEFEPMFFTPKQVEKLPIKILGKMVELRAKF